MIQFGTKVLSAKFYSRVTLGIWSDEGGGLTKPVLPLPTAPPKKINIPKHQTRVEKKYFQSFRKGLFKIHPISEH